MCWAGKVNLARKRFYPCYHLGFINLCCFFFSAVFVHWVFGLLILLFTDIWEVETKEEKTSTNRNNPRDGHHYSHLPNKD